MDAVSKNSGNHSQLYSGKTGASGQPCTYLLTMIWLLSHSESNAVSSGVESDRDS